MDQRELLFALLQMDKLVPAEISCNESDLEIACEDGAKEEVELDLELFKLGGEEPVDFVGLEPEKVFGDDEFFVKEQFLSKLLQSLSKKEHKIGNLSLEESRKRFGRKEFFGMDDELVREAVVDESLAHEPKNLSELVEVDFLLFKEVIQKQVELFSVGFPNEVLIVVLEC